MSFGVLFCLVVFLGGGYGACHAWDRFWEQQQQQQMTPAQRRAAREVYRRRGQ